MKKNNSKLNRKTKIMSTKTKFIFLMSFLALVIVGCVASMVIVLAAPKQKGILDVSIKYDAFAIRKEAEQFNGRDYYYIRMGEYPQTYAGAATSVTGLTETQEKFVCDMSTATGIYETIITYGKEYNIWTDLSNNKFIKHTINKNHSGEGNFINNRIINNQEVAFFRIEPIKWDIVGYYTDDSKTNFIKASDSINFNPSHTKNLVVSSRMGLQAIPWYANSSQVDIDYNQSFIYSWLRTFENNVLEKYKDDMIIRVDNYYTDTSETVSWSQIATDTSVLVAEPAREYAWIMSYVQAITFFDSDSERMLSASDFALANFALLGLSNSSIARVGTSYCWLRDSFSNIIDGQNYRIVGIIPNDGTINRSQVHSCYDTVKPCLLINL